METVLNSIHDATLSTIEVRWQEGLAVVNLILYSGMQQVFVRNLNSLTASRNFAWGESFQVNEFKIFSDRLLIEMQSGDTICIEGTTEVLSIHD